MKRYICIISASILIFSTSCEKDNLKEPGSTLKGRVIFQGQPVPVRSSGVQFELWQSGFQLYSKIPLNIKYDGTFSAVLFDGNYKLVRSIGAGPWADNTDTINIKLTGAADIDVPVEPYFILKNITFEKTGTTAVKVTFTIEKNTTTKTLELARLYVGPNLILDQNNNSANVQALAAAITLGQPTTLTVNIPAAIANDAFIYARLAVKTTGVAELLYTQSEKIQLK